MTSSLLSIFIGTSNETSDFIVDCLEQWWEANKVQHSAARRLAVNLDNGPENSGARTQFLYRLVRFADAAGLEVKLVYYPPYHSKYNLIERCWGILENHWNGTLLNSVHTVVEWARTTTWNLERGSAGRHPDREDLRQRCSHRQGRPQSRREPTATRHDPLQV